MRHKLTHKQREYCKRRAAGDGYADAYIGAGYSDGGGRKAAKDNAYNLECRTGETSTAIIQTIETLRRKAEDGYILDRNARLALLSDMALDASEHTSDRLRAADMLNRMQGDYDDRLRVEHGGGVTMSFSDRLEAIADALDNAQDDS